MGLLALQLFVATMVLQVLPVPGPVPAGWADLAFAAAAALAAWKLLQRRQAPPLVGGALPAALAYAAWVGLSAAVHRAGGWPALGALELALVLPVTHVLVTDDGARDRLLRTWIWSSAAWCTIGLIVAGLALAGVPVDPLMKGSGELDLALRPAGLCRPGMLAEASLAPLLLLAFDGRRLVGRWRNPLCVLIGVTLVLTLTRTVLAVVVGLLVWRALTTGRRGISTAGVALLLVALLASMHLDLHGERGQFRLTARPGIRWRIATSALSNAAAHPLFGVGPARQAALAGWPSPDDPSFVWDAHDTPLDLAATRGLPALLFYALAFALAFRCALRRPRTPLQLALLAALFATTFDALVVDVEDARHVWLLMALASG